MIYIEAQIPSRLVWSVREEFVRRRINRFLVPTTFEHFLSVRIQWYGMVQDLGEIDIVDIDTLVRKFWPLSIGPNSMF